jgi:hypothetical protein
MLSTLGARTFDAPNITPDDVPLAVIRAEGCACVRTGYGMITRNRLRAHGFETLVGAGIFGSSEEALFAARWRMDFHLPEKQSDARKLKF